MEISFVKEINLAYFIPHSIFSTKACRKDTFTTISISFEVFFNLYFVYQCTQYQEYEYTDKKTYSIISNKSTKQKDKMLPT